MHLRARLAALSLTVAAAGGLATPAVWASDDDRAMALDLFAQGRALRDKGQIEAALARFEAARRLMRTFGVLYNIAQCDEALGRTASAWTIWNEARAVAAQTSSAGDEQLAAGRQAALAPSLSRLTITVTPDADSSDLQVRRDGVLIPREVWGRPILVDPGTHVVEASAPGRISRRIEQPIGADADQRTVVVTALAPTPATPTPMPVLAARETPKSPAESASTGSGQRTAGWILSGLGLAGAGAGIAVALVGQGQHNDAVTADLAGDTSRAQTLESNANTTKTIGYAAIGGGGAVLIIGLVLAVTAPGASPRVAALRPAIMGDRCVGAVFSRAWP